MARYWQYGDPFMVMAVCDHIQAEHLLPFDHHQVIVNNCWGILITYHWMSLETDTEPRVATVHFNPAPKHTESEAQIRTMIRKHPVAPLAIQAIVGQLAFCTEA